MKKLFICILMGINIFSFIGCGQKTQDMSQNTTNSTIEENKEDANQEKTNEEEPKTENIKIDTSKLFVTLNGQQYEVGLEAGKLHVPNKNEICRIRQFQLGYDDGDLQDIMQNPNADYHPVWLTDGNDTISAVAFLYKGKPAILKLETNKFRFAIGTEEITDKETLDGVARFIFGESAYWDYINNEISRQQELKAGPQKKYSNDFEGDMERIEDEFMDDMNEAYNDFESEARLQQNIADDNARKAKHEIEDAFK